MLGSNLGSELCSMLLEGRDQSLLGYTKAYADPMQSPTYLAAYLGHCNRQQPKAAIGIRISLCGASTSKPTKLGMCW